MGALMRVGLGSRPSLGGGSRSRALRPLGPVQWRFEAFYLHGAVEPMTGESFFLEFTHSDSTCFEVYLEQLAQHYPHQLHGIQLEQGSLHTAKTLQLPAHVVLLFQPPHSPQLNPIEQLWQHLKATS